jgi:hypothetical protein
MQQWVSAASANTENRLGVLTFWFGKGQKRDSETNVGLPDRLHKYRKLQPIEL